MLAATVPHLSIQPVRPTTTVSILPPCAAPWTKLLGCQFCVGRRIEEVQGQQAASTMLQASRQAIWLPFPNVELQNLHSTSPSSKPQYRRSSVASALALTASTLLSRPRVARAITHKRPLHFLPPMDARVAENVDKWPVIPIWPTFGGGRVVPVVPSEEEDPFLLVAHHRHSFNPLDPFRPVFRTAGAGLGLPYLPNEGFDLHPHRGFEIATYILDGSDGFRHHDSLGNECVYRGGSVQWMRAGTGVLHEEMWETRPDRQTNVELFQIWINLPGRLKMEPPHIKMLGDNWGLPFTEHEAVDEYGLCSRVRMLAGSTDNGATTGPYHFATPLAVAHVHMEPGALWKAEVPPGHTVMVYVREGEALVPLAGTPIGTAHDGSWLPVPMLCSARLLGHGPVIIAASQSGADLLYLAGRRHGEPVARHGPIVMNHAWEVEHAYRELRNGTFLRKKKALVVV